MKTEKQGSGYAVIDYLRCKHPEAESSFKLERIYDGEIEQGSIVINNIFVSQRSTIFPSDFDTVLFKDRADTNRRFSTKLSTKGSSCSLTMNESSLKKELSEEILQLIEVFGL